MGTGVVDQAGPTPSSPDALLPQHHTLPSVCRPQECEAPVLTSAQLEPGLTGVGSEISSGSPSESTPSRARVLSPQQYSPPSSRTAQPWRSVRSSCCQSKRSPTCCGEEALPATSSAGLALVSRPQQ